MRWPAMLMLVLLALAGCDRRPAAALALPRDGRPRIVALGPAIAQMVAAAGAKDLLVGRHAYDPWSDQALTICGDQSGIDYETLLRVRPTHVLLQWGDRELPVCLTRLARRQGWTVKNYPLLKLDEVLSSADDITATWRGFAGGEPSALGSPSKQMQAVFARREQIDPSRIGRVLLLYGAARPAALGPGSYHHEMLVSLGATPAISSGAAFISLDAEDLLHLAPDAIVIIQPRFGAAPQAPRDAASLWARMGKLIELDLPAFRHDRIAIIDDPMALIPGTNLVQIAGEMADILERWSR